MRSILHIEFSLNRTFRECDLIEKAGLTETIIIQQMRQKTLRQRWDRPCSGVSPAPFRPFQRIVQSMCMESRISELTLAMLFVTRSMEVSYAGLDSNLTDRITLTSRTYNPQE